MSTDFPAVAGSDCDVLIVGGGLVGSALAAALADTEVRTVLVEARDPAVLEQPSFDSRVTALARGSQRILSGLGVWDALAPDAEPILSIHVSERGRFGAARIRADEEGVPALGFTLENRSLGRALWERIAAAERCTVVAPASMTRFTSDEDGVTAEIRMSPNGARAIGPSPASLTVRAKLLVAADGAESPVREALGIAMREDQYRQQAVIVNCATDLPHRGAAFERFTTRGPLAMLPLTRDRVGVVWTLPTDEAGAVAALPDDKFRVALEDVFGRRLGRVVRVGRRALHPLRRVRSGSLGTERVVLIGNAAVSLHPVAGQGFNLALRDVAALAEIVAESARDGWPDPAAVASRYRTWRVGDQRRVAWFTHGLVGLFGRPGAAWGTGRGLGLVAFDLLPGAKAALARHTMGVTGRLPRLARGLPLR
ncbi:MAG: 2-octaprenyl-6-methoxyphenyl hydroxylase [Gammaproteobacteria bacterium]|nr:2-octaprenyl-6-methoxyphenyl hydroxylase [Gammaproteobacteria bacterium]